MDNMEERPTPAAGALERLIFLSDGVFAIAITLLVLAIAIPAIVPSAQDVAQHLTPFRVQERDLPGKLAGLVPQILTYALSFIIISVYWAAHQRIFFYIRRADNVLIWLNIVFLLGVAFLPIPTAVLGRYGDHGAAVRFYALSLMVPGLMTAVIWWYATRNRRLVAKDLDAGLIRHHQERSLVAPAVLLLCLALSYVWPYLASASLVLIGVGIAVHERLYRQRPRPAPIERPQRH